MELFVFSLQAIIDATKRWVEEFVIDYNLCPFANPVYQAKKVKYVVSMANSTEQALFKLCQEVSVFVMFITLYFLSLNGVCNLLH
jgi:hypothetical protein